MSGSNQNIRLLRFYSNRPRPTNDQATENQLKPNTTNQPPAKVKIHIRQETNSRCDTNKCIGWLVFIACVCRCCCCRRQPSTHCIRSSLTLSKSMLTLTGASPSYASLWYPAVIMKVVDYVLELEIRSFFTLVTRTFSIKNFFLRIIRFF